MIGTTLGSYAIQRELGRGGMGAVYAGRHALLGRTAAVKVLLPQLSQHQETVQRFFNEARAATAIKHPGIVEIYDFGFEGGVAYIVMELCEGETLAARIRRLRVLPVDAAMGVARQIASALAAAHAAGIVHRDLKPDNVFLVADPEVASGERIKLLDFGIAKLAGDAPGVAKTTTGAIIGTPLYMSPEQCRGAGQVDARSDLYALGCMLYEMLCGRVPFLGEGAGDIISAHILVPPAAPRTLAPELPLEVEALILRLLAKKPADRPPTAEDVIAELHRLSGSAPRTSAARTGPGAVEDASAHADTLLPTQPRAKTSLDDERATTPRPARSRAPLWLGVGLAGGVAIAAAVVMTAGRGGSSSSSGGTPALAALATDAATGARPQAIDAAPPAGADPDALTIVIGPMGGASVQRAAAAALARAAPSVRVFIDGDPGAIGATRAFFLDTSDEKVETSGEHVSCSLRMTLAAYPDRAMFGFLNGSAKVDATGTGGTGLDESKIECAEAVVEDLIRRRVMPTIEARLASPPPAPTTPTPAPTPNPPAPAPAPKPPADEPDGLTQDDMRPVLQRYATAMRLCYERQLKTDPALRGTVDVSFTVDVDGRVSAVVATGLDATVDACVERVMRTVRFPAARRPTSAHVPLAFQKPDL